MFLFIAIFVLLESGNKFCEANEELIISNNTRNVPTYCNVCPDGIREYNHMVDGGSLQILTRPDLIRDR